LGFEFATGRRRVGQDAKGNYMVTASPFPSILVINHTGIPDDKTRRALKVRWREVADSLAK